MYFVLSKKASGKKEFIGIIKGNGTFEEQLIEFITTKSTPEENYKISKIKTKELALRQGAFNHIVDALQDAQNHTVFDRLRNLNLLLKS